MITPAVIGFVTISDRASQGVYEDKGGPAMQAWIGEVLSSEWRGVSRLIPDEQAVIEQTLIDLADVQGCDLILTTGGTGPALRDVTPEATINVCQKMMDGFAEQMRAVSLQYVPTAILSRQVAGIRGKTLIINLPGKPTAIGQCLEGVFAAVPYCLDLIGANRIETHPEKITAFRPKGA
jgi:molybdopterin adenylyltransferase